MGPQAAPYPGALARALSRCILARPLSGAPGGGSIEASARVLFEVGMEPTIPGHRAAALPRVPDVNEVVRGKYRLLRLLGDGGMASVYEARHEGLGVKVALKFLHPRLLRWPDLVQRFLDEARLAAPIRSPSVVQVLDVDRSDDGLAFIVLELLFGQTLRELLNRRRL